MDIPPSISRGKIRNSWHIPTGIGISYNLAKVALVGSGQDVVHWSRYRKTPFGVQVLLIPQFDFLKERGRIPNPFRVWEYVKNRNPRIGRFCQLVENLYFGFERGRIVGQQFRFRDRWFHVKELCFEPPVTGDVYPV